MKALVTGGAGFIGSHLTEALCRAGASVTVLDNLSVGSPENLSWRKAGDALELVQGDICNRTLVRKLLPGCDWVFHQAALASVPLSVAEPERSNRENLEATLALLQESREVGIKRFIFASSCSVYGTLARPASEGDPINPLSPYALQKYTAEHYARMFHALYGFPAVALRYFNVFGPRQSFSSPYSGVIARFCSAILEGKRPVIFGDGSQTRDFVYVSNVVRANLLAVERAEAPGNVFNIGTGVSTSLLDLVNELNRETGQKLRPDFQSARAGDVQFSRADVSKAERVLGYQPTATLQAGMRETLQYYRAKREGDAPHPGASPSVNQ
ncbi:MAG TPA: SDR family oxidoreductase [Verrucomicrobiae bacterium]|jgi:UDP-glucose 4-epimerase|nr:SDR family oxidoreductase [Verrucomicrobiae bacterium]